MLTKDQIVACFQELNIVASDTVLDKCLEICLKYNIEAEDFCDQWYAFTASHLNGAAPTVEYLEKLERKEFQKNKDQTPYKKLASTPASASTSYKLDESTEDNSMVVSYTATTPKRPRNQDHQTVAKTTNVIHTTAEIHSIDNSNAPSHSQSEKYKQRSDSGSVQCRYGPPSGNFQREKDYPVVVKNANEERSLGTNFKYMYEVMGKKAMCLNNMTQWLGHAILDKHHLVLTEGTLKSHLGDMVTYGRIVSDSDGKINAQSILLEGSIETNLGSTVQLNLNKVPKFSLFPGQVVAVQGNNPNSNQIQIVVASGPYTLQNSLTYEPLKDLLKYVSEYKPHVLILVGPFLEKNHECIHNGGLTQTFDTFFEGLVENIMNFVKDTSIQIVIVSSQNDAHHHPVYPTPPYSTRDKYANLTFAPDPCMINVNGLVIGATSADILFHMSHFETYQDKQPAGPVDRMGRLASHLLNQHSFYPLYPPHKGICLDHELFEQYGVMECKPHILILPSNLRHFIKNIEDCLVINPERLTKGYVAGTFARISVDPGSSQSVCNRSVCEIVLLAFSVLYFVNADEINSLVFKYKYRNVRNCQKLDDELRPFYRENLLESPLYLIFLIFLGIVLILLLLGIIKGLIGLVYIKVGQFGLGLLVDLPKPLDSYQEKEIKYRTVIYDVGGWPVHPDTKERTVRVLTKKTEFCLNTIFFIAYPLALILQLCALCCCIKNYSENDESCVKSINVIKFNEGIAKQDRYQTPGQKIDMYKENDAKEDADTKYVINMMKQSQISLQKNI
ncbi:hypothetical protein NQ315_009464 [Exocentrus adspersus]|uniref:DNA polymerase alpha subunit B n=1 Tax=Exocentrus adspersus TaxID=1586481 RepID=A0AAV8WHK3_9CUCU|nr:hypothetical protein NQ315_009464 [Exocentrus adspersus]